MPGPASSLAGSRAFRSRSPGNARFVVLAAMPTSLSISALAASIYANWPTTKGTTSSAGCWLSSIGKSPVHLSLVGGDPLVRYRELEVLLPQLAQRGIHVQLVTSAFRPLPKSWSSLSKLSLVVSIDGLQPEHDERRNRLRTSEFSTPFATAL